MANPIAACILITCGLLFMVQIMLEYYLHITEMANDNIQKKAIPKYLTSNKVFQNEI